ncbi:MAG: RraA family protein [Actinomycetota bacterium]|nr:RraA family protein [Actinomycetota bacterium]
MKNMESIIERYKKLSTPAISDALDKMGIRCGCEGLKPIFYGLKAVGYAVTLKYAPVSLKNESVGDYIDDIKEGSMLVLDNEGRTDCTVWGGILTVVSKEKNIAGTVINGVCRDVEVIRELKYPLWSKGHFMVTGKDRVGLIGFNVPVSIGNIRVNHNDLVVADDSGVVVVPEEKINEIADAAELIEKKEEEILKSFKKGLSLREARQIFGYHNLQRKNKS